MQLFLNAAVAPSAGDPEHDRDPEQHDEDDGDRVPAAVATAAHALAAAATVERAVEAAVALRSHA